jgi:hypothetical protein
LLGKGLKCNATLSLLGKGLGPSTRLVGLFLGVRHSHCQAGSPLPIPTRRFRVAHLLAQIAGAEPKNLGFGTGKCPSHSPVRLSALLLVNQIQKPHPLKLRDLLGRHEKIVGSEGALLISLHGDRDVQRKLNYTRPAEYGDIAPGASPSLGSRPTGANEPRPKSPLSNTSDLHHCRHGRGGGSSLGTPALPCPPLGVNHRITVNIALQLATSAL